MNRANRAIRRSYSLDVTSVGHVITSTSHAYRHQVHRGAGPATSSSVGLLSPVRPPRSYEQQLEDGLERMRLRAKSAEHQLINERAKSRQLTEKLNELQTTYNETLARLTTRAQQTTDSLKSRVRLMNGRCQQLTHDLQRLQDQLRVITTDKNGLEIQLQQQQQQRQLPHKRQDEWTVERREAMTQTTQQLDLTTLYQLLTNITLTRLDQLEIPHNHLPSRDQPPANQLRRTTSLPASDVTTDDDVLETTSPQQQYPRNDDVVMTSETRSRHSSLLNFDIFKKLQTSRRARADVINTYKPPTTVRRDITSADVTADTAMTSFSVDMTSSKASSFKRLQHRRNGLTDLSYFQQSRDVTSSTT